MYPSADDEPTVEIADWPGVMPEVTEAVSRCLEDGSWGKYEGRHNELLCELLGDYFQQERVTLCSSGTMAVELALRGLGVEPGDEVILGGYDFPGNFRAIEAIGAIPVLVDMETEHFAINCELVQEAISDQTTAVIISHLHGSLAPLHTAIDPIRSQGIAVLEDACQCPGARLAGQPVGGFGDAAVLSFGGSKLLSAGRGGAVLTRSDRVHQRIKVFQDRGNLAFPLSELQAAALIPQMKSLETYHALRLRGAIQLRNALAMESGAQIRLRFDASPEDSPAFYKFPLLVPAKAREPICKAAHNLGIPLYPGFHGFASRSSRRCRIRSTLDNARRFAAETVLLHHPALLLEEPEIQWLALKLKQILAEPTS